MQVTLPNKALWKIITVWRQSAPLTPQIILEMSDSHWRQSILSPSDAIGKFSTQQNFQGHQWQRTCMIQHNQTKVKLMPIVLKNCNISHKKLPKLEIVDQWSTRIPLPHRRGWQWAMGGLQLNIVQNHKAAISKATYRLSNIRCTSNIRPTPTLGNSQLEFSPTISLAKTSNTSRTPSFDFWVSIVDKVRSRPTWSELLRVAWNFDSPWIKGPMTPYQSRPYARHVAVIPAAKLSDSIAIVFLSIEVRIRHNLRRYIDGSAILFWLSRDPYDPDDQRFHHASRGKLCGIKRYFDKITSVCDKLSISNYIFQA